jgi:hypothetical protein
MGLNPFFELVYSGLQIPELPRQKHLQVSLATWNVDLSQLSNRGSCFYGHFVAQLYRNIVTVT